MKRIARTRRYGPALTIGLIAALAITACGSSNGGGTNTAIVSFAGHTIITRAALAHWVPIEAVISRDLTIEHPAPPGEVPDPPNYTACINYEKTATLPAHSIIQPHTTSELKAKCKARYENIVRHMLHILINYQWVNQQAHAMSITITPQELQEGYTRLIRGLFPTETAYHNYLKATGETITDELQTTKSYLQATKLRNKLLQQHGIPGAIKYFHETPQQLAAQTNCSPGYIIPNCKQYKGPQPPEM